MANAVACFGCRRYPRLSIQHLQFDNGVLTVYSEADAKLVRQADDSENGNITELDLKEPNNVEPIQLEGRARVGMRSSATDLDALPNENEPSGAPDPATDTPEVVWPENSVLAKPGGWYVYQGKNYRKAQLPEAARRLV